MCTRKRKKSDSEDEKEKKNIKEFMHGLCCYKLLFTATYPTFNVFFTFPLQISDKIVAINHCIAMNLDSLA
jgi:hypothetical protein